MKIISCEQYSDEWWSARRGIPSASAFGRILTPTGKPSTQSKKYMYELLAESVIGEEETKVEPTEWMQRGTEMEAEARDWFSFEIGADIDEVGFCISDDGKYGASPDGIITDEKIGIEIKCPKASTHIGYLENGKLPGIYKPQIHGQMLVTGFKKWTFISYHPSFRPLIVTVTPDEYTNQLKVAVNQFAHDMEKTKARLKL
jgi:putative phage-type endonuclease